MKKVLIDFYADWCGPCQMMKSVLDDFEKNHPEVEVRRVNIDEEEELAERYNVSSIPCFVVEVDGKEISREVGMLPLKKLEKLVGEA